MMKEMRSEIWSVRGEEVNSRKEGVERRQDEKVNCSRSHKEHRKNGGRKKLMQEEGL